MKNLLFILLVAFPLIAFGINKEKLKHIPVSRWKEIKCLKPDSVTVVPVTDTLFIAFRAHDSFAYHGMNGFIYKGPYIIDIDNNTIDFGYFKYKLLLRKPGMLVMADDMGIYQFAIDSSDTVKQIILPKEDSALPVTGIDQMIGHWTVYKRAADGPVSNFDYIKSVYITGQGTEDKLGYVYVSSDADESPSSYIRAYTTDQVLECEGKNTHSLKVLRCQKGEMVLQEKGIKYYCKQFK